jgi:mono/diheme cytochrome c family protein
VTRGIAGTAMPAFNASLSPAELTAVVAYVSTLNGISNPLVATAANGPAPTPLNADAARGRALFSEAAKSFGRCSTCHEIGGLGIPVATPIGTVPTNAAALKNLQTPSVVTATVGGENIPALMVSRKSQAVTFYDLSSAPPVLRTVAPTEIQTRDGSSWSHASFATGYKDTETESILTFLRANQP